MANLILIIGKTASGKDTVARYIERTYGFLQVVSYTTRPMRVKETQGKEHIFVSSDAMKRILEDEKILAYTKFPETGYEYCASVEALRAETCVYIINPDGVRWLKEHRPDTKTFSIYVDLPEGIIRERAKKRGDDIDAIEKRLSSEREEFDDYKNAKLYDYLMQDFQGKCK